MSANSYSVLHVATSMTWRGGEQQVAYLVEELLKKRVPLWVLCSEQSAMEDYCRRNHVPYIVVKKRSSFDLLYALRIASFCKQHNISIVHTHDSHAHTFAVLAAALFRNRSRIVVSRRVDFPLSNNILSSYKYNHPKIARILCVSEKIRHIVAGSIKDPALVVTVHSGIDVSRFRGRGNAGILHREYFLPSNIKIIGNISALAPHKDYRTFLETANQLRNALPDCVFFIIGEGSERHAIEKHIERLQLQQKVFMTGFRDDIADILPELNLMLVTSETEGLGTTILDAFACGVPVVATAAGGIPELVIHQKTGMLASVGDVSGLAAMVLQVMKNEELRTRLTEGAETHLENFSREATAAKTMIEYAAVAGTSL